jgi:hypothetical protein
VIPYLNLGNVYFCGDSQTRNVACVFLRIRNTFPPDNLLFRCTWYHHKLGFFVDLMRKAPESNDVTMVRAEVEAALSDWVRLYPLCLVTLVVLANTM